MTNPTTNPTTDPVAAPLSARRRASRPRTFLAFVATIAAGAIGTIAAPVAAQDAAGGRALAARVSQGGDGTVRFSFASREGVCGNGHNVSVRRSGDVEWESDCEPGPVRVALTVRGGEVTDVRSYVGGRWRADAAATDLGTVAAPAAASYLLDLASRLPAGPAEDAVFPATIADSATAWPALLRIARDESRPAKVRRQAVFWVGQAAGEEASRGLTELVDADDADLRVREHAVFALSQRPTSESVPALLRIARTSGSPRLRQRAIFWLGQSQDPRALAYFEEVLVRQ